MNEPRDRSRLVAFGVLIAVGALAVAAYARYFRGQSTAAARGATAVDSSSELRRIAERPYLLFRNTALGPGYGRLAMVPLDAAGGTRYLTPLSCDRVHATRTGGLCLVASRGVFTSYRADAFDGNFRVYKTFPLEGVPSRARVSLDGTAGGTTVFVAGDSYAVDTFSTRTTLFDLKGGKALGDLEEFAVERDGRPFKRVDFNFWGVTFAADADLFYAVVASQRRFYLAEGRQSTRRMRIVREGLECPSLSPDGRRIAFKAREYEGPRLVWRLRVVDLMTNAESTVNETRSVDDQAEWLDVDHVLYSLPRTIEGDGSSDVWVARVDGGGVPRVLLADAYSPTVVRAP